MDYQALLKRYIALVLQAGGIDHIDFYGRGTVDVQFTDHEWAELERMSNEVAAERTAAHQEWLREHYPNKII